MPFGAEGHRVKCTRCGQLVGDLLPHSWVYASHELYCPACYYIHSEGCTGELTGTPNADGATHTIFCPICGVSANGGAHDQNGEGGTCSVCGFASHPVEPIDPPVDPIDPSEPVDPTKPTEPETPTDSEEGEKQDE